MKDTCSVFYCSTSGPTNPQTQIARRGQETGERERGGRKEEEREGSRERGGETDEVRVMERDIGEE